MDKEFNLLKLTIKHSYHEAKQIVRGEILKRAVLLESMIDVYPGQYFCNEKSKQREIIELVFSSSRMTFENKRQVFKFLVDKHNPDFVKNYRSYASDLDKLNTHRNIFAHYPINNLPKGIEMFEKHGIITFLKFKNSIDIEAYDDKKFNEVLDLFKKATSEIINLLK